MPEPIARDEVIKSSKTREQISGNDPVTLPEQQQSQQGGNQDWCPGQKPVVGREEHILQRRGGPEPLLSIPEPKRVPVDDPARDQRGQERNGSGSRIQSVRSKQPRDSRRILLSPPPGLVVGGEGLAPEDHQQQGVRIIYVDHQPRESTQQHPLTQRALSSRAVPIPEK